MECADYRKKLKNYAESSLNFDEKEKIEAHIEKCPVCLRELSMWQEVIEKQKKIANFNSQKGLADRIRETGKKMEREIYMAPSARRLNYVAKTLRSPVGFIISVTTAVIMGLAVLFILIKKQLSPAFYILMIIGGFSLIFVSIRLFFLRKK